MGWVRPQKLKNSMKKVVFLNMSIYHPISLLKSNFSDKKDNNKECFEKTYNATQKKTFYSEENYIFLSQIRKSWQQFSPSPFHKQTTTKAN